MASLWPAVRKDRAIANVAEDSGGNSGGSDDTHGSGCHAATDSGSSNGRKARGYPGCT
jgi:hypothetical protein